MRSLATIFQEDSPFDDEKPKSARAGNTKVKAKTPTEAAVSPSRVARKASVKQSAATSIPEKAQDFLAKKVAEAKKALEEKKKETTLVVPKIPSSSSIEQRVLQAVLPLWDDDNRAVPNHFIRSGLFTVNSGIKRDFIPDLQIASLSNLDVVYRGEELQQSDLTVWMALINMARDKPLSEAIYFTGYQIVTDCGWRLHTDSYKKVKDAIKRLKVTALSIAAKGNESAYAGSLIRDYAFTDNTSEDGNTKWMVRFEPRISALFMEDNTTLLQWEERKRIGPRAKLAQWLHAFYFSHRGDPLPNAVERLHELCRSKDTLSSFRRNLKTALLHLVEKELIQDFTVVNDMVRVFKFDRPRLAAVKTTRQITKKKTVL